MTITEFQWRNTGKEMGAVETEDEAGKRGSWEQRPKKGVWKMYIN